MGTKRVNRTGCSFFLQIFHCYVLLKKKRHSSALGFTIEIRLVRLHDKLFTFFASPA